MSIVIWGAVLYYFFIKQALLADEEKMADK